jgi:hypothetical protein
LRQNVPVLILRVESIMGPGPKLFRFFPLAPERSCNTERDLREAQLVYGVEAVRKVLWAPVPDG